MELLIVLLIVIVVWFVATYNKFVTTEVKINEAYADIEAGLEKRYDSLEQIYSAAQKYMNYEQKVIFDSVKFRTGMSPSELADFEQGMAKAANTFNAVAEAYPQLAASGLLKNYQTAVAETEDTLFNSRRIFNSNVSTYNKLVVAFPSSLIADMKHYTQKEMFKASAGKREGFKIPMD